jgi:hypothetical protein
MSDGSDRAADRFTVTYTEDEVLAFSNLVSRRIDHGPSWDAFWTVFFGVLLGMGFAAFAAMAFGLFPREAFRPVLASAYIAFFAGAAVMWWVTYLRNRSLMRADVREGRCRACEYVFDDTGVSCKTADFETRMPWHAMRGVEDAGGFVLIWLYDRQAAGIPSRLFADAAARGSFVASIAARIKAAKAGAR